MKNIQEINEQNLDPLRHSCAHLLAAAVKELYPDAKLAIGPAIENGFYYDIEFSKPITDEDLPKIEKKMAELLPSWTHFEHKEVTPEEARKLFGESPYKLELIDELEQKGEKITVYTSGNFADLCRGGHADNPSKEIGAFKLLSLAGAYWRGDEKNAMLTRIYGTCFPTKEELDLHLENLEEARRRDHRKLAQELDLIVFSDLVGGGLPLYTPKGAVLRNEVYNFSRQLNTEIGFQETALPGMNRGELFKVSGHYDKYKDDMFNVVSHYSKEEFFLKPMNCPQHCVIYGSRLRSYKDLPLKFADFSVLYRDEKPGELNGLFRSRAFTQDDGHAFVREDQIKQEFENVLKAIDKALNAYGFSYWIRLSLRDPHHKEKYLGDDAVWERAESTLLDILKSSNLPYKPAEGEAAIYGPKLDFIAKDSLGREWQISTVQLDMIIPVRFGLKYIDADGSEKTPFMIHRALIGSERFIAIIIEHFGGAFPTWLSPVQVMIVPITDRNNEYGQKLLIQLKENNIRAEIDERGEKMQAKIRDAQLQKVPYMAILGDREQAEGKVAIRKRNGENVGVISIEQFLANLKQEIAEKKQV